MLTVIGDASGSAVQRNEAAQIVAGFMANSAMWDEFDAAWRAFLHKHSLARLHMTELSPDPVIRGAILDDAIAVITTRHYELRAFSMVVDAADFQAYQAKHGTDPRASLGAGHQAYPFAAQAHIAMIDGYCEDGHLVRPYEFIYEAGDPFQSALEEALVKKGYPKPTFRTKADGPLGLQAADFFAFELLRGYRDGVVFDEKRLVRRQTKGEPSHYLLSFAKMPGRLGAYTSNNLSRLRPLMDTVERLAQIRDEVV
jgi:hypothetical protein